MSERGAKPGTYRTARMTDTTSSPNAAASPSLKSRALRLLAQREHTRLELQQKLSPYEPAPDELNSVLDRLEQAGLINESRVLASVLYRRSAQRGAVRITNELQQKGVSPALIAQAEAELKTTEVSRARAVWQKKFGTVAATAQEHARQWRFMSGRGFDAGVVRQILSAHPGGDDEA